MIFTCFMRDRWFWLLCCAVCMHWASALPRPSEQGVIVHLRHVFVQLRQPVDSSDKRNRQFRQYKYDAPHYERECAGNSGCFVSVFVILFTEMARRCFDVSWMYLTVFLGVLHLCVLPKGRQQPLSLAALRSQCCLYCSANRAGAGH